MSCDVCRVDYERIEAVGPDRAASEWLLRCGAKVRFQGFDRWHHDYNGLPTGPLGRYKIQAVDATESCIMHRGFDHLGQSLSFCHCVHVLPPVQLQTLDGCERPLAHEIHRKVTRPITGT